MQSFISLDSNHLFLREGLQSCQRSPFLSEIGIAHCQQRALLGSLITVMLAEVKYLWRVCFLSPDLIFKLRFSNLIEMLITHVFFLLSFRFFGSTKRSFRSHLFCKEWHIGGHDCCRKGVAKNGGGVEEMGGTYFQSSQRIVGSRSIRWFALNTQYWRVELHSLIITPGLSLLSFVTFDKLIPLRIIFFISKMQITFLYSVPCISFLLLP